MTLCVADWLCILLPLRPNGHAQLRQGAEGVEGEALPAMPRNKPKVDWFIVPDCIVSLPLCSNNEGSGLLTGDATFTLSSQSCLVTIRWWRWMGQRRLFFLHAHYAERSLGHACLPGLRLNRCREWPGPHWVLGHPPGRPCTQQQWVAKSHTSGTLSLAWHMKSLIRANNTEQCSVVELCF